MTTRDDLTRALKTLRLSGVLQTMDLRVRQAVDDALDHEEFLYRLFADEVERREAKQSEVRVRRAGFEHEKSLEAFDFTFNTRIPRAKIIDLATCTFVDRAENILLVGPTGLGKSHIAQALGHRACFAGRNVVFTSVGDLFTKLRASRADNTYERVLGRYLAADLLIIDDLGLRQLVGDEPVDLYELIRRRYEHGSIILTSNRAPEELAGLFKDPLLAGAAMDRLLHHAHVLVLEGESYRNPSRRRAPTAAAA